MRDPVRDAAALIARARRLLVTTGAGMSRESGIPTFRDAPGAMWVQYDPMQLATAEGFARDPGRVWRWYADRRRMISRATPHAGHTALARLERIDWDDFLLVTQNIDNLHRVAGSDRLVELHGNIFRFKCVDRHHPVTTLPDTDDSPPRCACGSLIRPDVVWFGEVLPTDALDAATRAAMACDVMLVVGTSGIVYPAAGLPVIAREAGARVVEVNPEATPITAAAHIFVPSPAGEALPGMVDEACRLRDEQMR